MPAIAAAFFFLSFSSWTPPALAVQSFHGQKSPHADGGGWRKVELWKERLVHADSVRRLDLVLANRAAVQGGGPRLDELRREILAATQGAPMSHGVLESEYVQLTLGYFDLSYPIWFLQDQGYVKELQRLALALLDLQREFLEWTGLAAAARASERVSEPPVCTLLAELRALYEDWKPKFLAASSLDLAEERFEAFNAVPQASSFAEYMRRQVWMDEVKRAEALEPGEGDVPSGLDVVMAADWQNFLALACGLAVLDEVEAVKDDGRRLADYVWFDSLPSWTYFYWSEGEGPLATHYQVMGSEYASTDDVRAWELETPGVKMDSVTQKKTGLEQHLVQHIGERFLHMNFGERAHLAVQNGFATDLVFEVYDENKEKSSGSGVSNQTQAREVFIPGAPSAGGFLPPISAENRVRREWKAKPGEGGDRFAYFLSHELGPGLKVAKKQLGKEVDDHPYYFPIFPSDANLDKRVIYPPLFATPEVTLPEFFKGAPFEEYAADHRSVFRAYKVYFAWWMRTHAAAEASDNARVTSAKSSEAFARFLRLAARKAKEAGPLYVGDTIGIAPFLAAVEEVYGIPLTAADFRDHEHPGLEARCMSTLE